MMAAGRRCLVAFQIIWKLADPLEANAESLARLVENTGKPYEYVSLGGDIPLQDNLRFFAGAVQDTHGSRRRVHAGYTSIYRREPVALSAVRLELSADGCLEDWSGARTARLFSTSAGRTLTTLMFLTYQGGGSLMVW
jgi:hypothetical protein